MDTADQQYPFFYLPDTPGPQKEQPFFTQMVVFVLSQ